LSAIFLRGLWAFLFTFFHFVRVNQHIVLRPNRPIKSRRACRITPLSRNIQEKLVFVYPARGDRRARGESVFFLPASLTAAVADQKQSILAVRGR
jgi:hypothetical protein